MKQQVPVRYREYQSNRVQKIWESLKFLEYDEFHNAQGMADVQRMVEMDFREGRKYNLVPVLSSKRFQEFSKSLIKTANTFFIMGVGSEGAIADITTTIGLSEEESSA